MFLSHLYIIVIAVAFGCSLIAFKLSSPSHFKLLSVLIGVALIVEFAAVDGLRAFGMKNNMIIYNPFMLIEFCVYALFFKKITRFNALKKLLKGYIIFFIFFWIISVVFVFGINTWISHISIVGSTFTIFFALAYYYQVLTDVEVRSLKYNPEFWIATGLIVFYAGNLPYTGMLNFLITNYESLASQLDYVLKVLNIVMYSLFAYAYLCQPKTNLASST